MSYLRYLGLFALRGIQHILCCVFALYLFIFVSYIANFTGLPEDILSHLLGDMTAFHVLSIVFV